MSVLWVLLVTLASAPNGKAVTEDLVEQDASANEECVSETCSPTRPIPIATTENDWYRTDLAREEKQFRGIFHGEEIETSFTCDDKPYIPGFYADLETGCQIFHLCMENLVDHLVCPSGTGFDQKYFICSPDGKRNCKLATLEYVRKLRIPDTFPFISGIEGYDGNQDSVSFLYGKLKDFQGADPDMLESNLIRLLLLLQFIEVSRVIPDIVVAQDSSVSIEEKQVRTLPIFSSVLEHMMFNVFPLIPENYSSDSRVPLEHLDSGNISTTFSKHKGDEHSPEALWSSGSIDLEKVSEGEISATTTGETSEKSRKFLSSLKDPGLRALRIMKTILDVIANVSSRISPFSRKNVVANYMNYLNKFSGSSKNFTEM